MYKDLQNTYVKAATPSRQSRLSGNIRYSDRISSQYETEENGDRFGDEDEVGKMGSQNQLLSDVSPLRDPEGGAEQENLYDSVEHGNDVYYNPST